MTRMIGIGLAATALALSAGCQTLTEPATPPAPSVVDIRQAMVEGVNPAALDIWDVGNTMIDDQGRLDPAALDAATMGRLREAAQQLDTYAAMMDRAEVLQASGPDLVGGEVPDGVASRAQIQAAIDANPAGFRAYSRAMGDEARAILAAIAAGDREAAANRVQSFDGACQACHERYWYVNQ